MKDVYLIADDEILAKLRANDDSILNYILGTAQIEVWPYTSPVSPSRYSNIIVKEKTSYQSWRDHFELAMRKIDECELVIFVDRKEEKIPTDNQILLNYARITGKEIHTISLPADILETLIKPKIRVYFNTYTGDVASAKFENWKE